MSSPGSLTRATFAFCTSVSSEPQYTHAAGDPECRPSVSSTGSARTHTGTASYDLEKFRTKQCKTFQERGVDVRTLDVARTTPPQATVDEALGAADAVLVSGGNTLFAVERWRRAGLVAPLRAAAERGAVMCGGSAGAICWFDGGHSDSADPDWFRAAMLAGEGAAAEGYGVGPPASPDLAKPWAYVRVGGLGFLPGRVHQVGLEEYLVRRPAHPRAGISPTW